MTAEQEYRMERLALKHGRVFVDEGYIDGHVYLTVPGGACFNVQPSGNTNPTQPNHSVRWDQ